MSIINCLRRGQIKDLTDPDKEKTPLSLNITSTSETQNDKINSLYFDLVGKFKVMEMHIYIYITKN